VLRQKGFQGEKLEVAYLLLVENSVSDGKVEKIKTLLKGLDPSLDGVLEKFSKAYSFLGKLERGEVLLLSAENLPERNDKEKKRKKLIVGFFTQWKSLKGEVSRLREIYRTEESDSEAQSAREEVTTKQISSIGKILGFAKGPLGLITLAAVAVVGLFGYLSSSSVSVSIKNEGCTPLDPKVKMPLKIPGLMLPDKPILSGETAKASLPPLKFDVDGTSGGSVTLSFFRYSFSFNVRDVKSISLDGKNLLGTKGEVDLGSSKTHNLIISCQ